MIDPVSKLTVLHDDNGVFIDHTEDAADYTRDAFSLTLVAAEDYLYLGFFKPVGSLYAALDTANTNATTMTVDVFNGTSWVTADPTDESKGMTRSGFMFWDTTNMTSTAVDGTDLFWVRMKPDVDSSAMDVRGLNLVFADDSALKTEFFQIDNSNLLPPGENSQLVQHVAARNTIVQMLRNLQYIKTDETAGTYVNLTQWDLFDLFEIRQAATYLALSKIFFILTDSPDDTWWVKYREYQDKFEAAFSLARITLDSNNNGVKDSNENLVKFKVSRWQR